MRLPEANYARDARAIIERWQPRLNALVQDALAKATLNSKADVARTYGDTPLRAGDAVLTVDGQTLAEWVLDEVPDRKVGDVVTYEVLRTGSGLDRIQKVEVTLTRYPVLDAVRAQPLVPVTVGVLLLVELPQRYQVLMVLAAAFVVALVVFLVARTGLPLVILPSLMAPLVTLLPGAALTTGAVELSTGQMISGAGRIAAGGMQLVLLALGLLTGCGGGKSTEDDSPPPEVKTEVRPDGTIVMTPIESEEEKKLRTPAPKQPGGK